MARSDVDPPFSTNIHERVSRADRGPFNLHPLARHLHLHLNNTTTTTTTTSVRESILRRRLLFLYSIIPSCQCLSFLRLPPSRHSLSAAPLSPPSTLRTPCRSLALLGRFWRLLPRRRRHNSATSPDLLNRCFFTSITTAFAAPAAAHCTIGFVCPLLTRAATANRPSNIYLA